jgi:hypothetical protein
MKSRYVFALTVSVAAAVGMDSVWAIDTSKPVTTPQTQRTAPLATNSANVTGANRPGTKLPKTNSQTLPKERTQQSMDKKSKFQDTLSNIMKKESDTDEAISQNIK